MITRLNLHTVGEIKKLTLDAPRLQNVKLVHSSLQLELVHDESVESLFIDILERIDLVETIVVESEVVPVKKLKNLKCLYSAEGDPGRFS